MPHYRAEILTIFGLYFGRNDDFINLLHDLYVLKLFPSHSCKLVLIDYAFSYLFSYSSFKLVLFICPNCSPFLNISWFWLSTHICNKKTTFKLMRNRLNEAKPFINFKDINHIWDNNWHYTGLLKPITYVDVVNKLPKALCLIWLSDINLNYLMKKYLSLCE